MKDLYIKYRINQKILIYGFILYYKKSLLEFKLSRNNLYFYLKNYSEYVFMYI